MISEFQIPGPVLFNPLKHHLGFISEFVFKNAQTSHEAGQTNMIKELKHLGASVMDIYTGLLPINEICMEVLYFLRVKGLTGKRQFSAWAGTKMKEFRIISLSDDSQWTLKYFDNNRRFVHLFPARRSRHSFRVKSNTLKSAILYYVLIGKDFITGDDLNKVRPLVGLSPVKDQVDTKAITEMIEILRNYSI